MKKAKFLIPAIICAVSTVFLVVSVCDFVSTQDSVDIFIFVVFLILFLFTARNCVKFFQEKSKSTPLGQTEAKPVSSTSTPGAGDAKPTDLSTGTSPSSFSNYIKQKKAERESRKEFSPLPDGSVPVVIDSSVMLTSGEVCHFSCDATRYILHDRIAGYTSSGSGFNIHVAKGLNYHVGGGTRTPVREKTAEPIRGHLVITNTRIIFSTYSHGFDKKLKNITAMEMFDDGFMLQFSSDTMMIQLNKCKYSAKYVTGLISYLCSLQG